MGTLHISHRLVLPCVGMGLLLGACAEEKASGENARPPILQLGRTDNLPGCDSTGTWFSQILGRSLADRQQAMVIGISDTSSLSAGHGGRHPQGGGMGGPPGGGGGMGGGMGGPPGGGDGMGGGMGGPPGGGGSGSMPSPPKRFMVSSVLVLHPDSAGSARSLGKVDTALPASHALRLSVALKLVDQSSGRAVWHGNAAADSLSGVGCPSRDAIEALARKASRTVLEGIPRDEAQK